MQPPQSVGGAAENGYRGEHRQPRRAARSQVMPSFRDYFATVQESLAYVGAPG